MNFGQIFGAPADVLFVDGGGSVGEVFHGFSLGNSGAGHAAGGGDAQGMKTGVGEFLGDTDAAEEFRPFVAPRDRRIGFGCAGGLEFFEQRTEFWVERLSGVLISFLVEANKVEAKVDVGHGVEAGFVEAHAMPSGNEIGVPEHGAAGLGLKRNAGYDAAKVIVGEFRPESARGARQAKFDGGIDLQVSAPNSFLHNDTKDCEFENGGIAAGAIFALIRFWCISLITRAMPRSPHPSRGRSRVGK